MTVAPSEVKDMTDYRASKQQEKKMITTDKLNAVHFEALKRLAAAGVKITDCDWQAKYLEMTATIRAEKVAA